MERSTEFNSQPDDLGLFQVNQRRHDANIALFGSGLDELVERLVVGRAAVGIAGRVLLDGADKDGLCT